MSISRRFVVLGLVAFALSPATQARLAVDLEGGFEPDPAIFEVEVQGSRAADEWVRGCPGFLDTDEALAISLRGAMVPLRFHLRGDGLRALVVRGPDGIHRCAATDDDGLAEIHLERVLEGGYQVWPATAQAGAVGTATLLVTERVAPLRDLLPTPPPAAEGLEPARLGTARIDPDPDGGRQLLASGPLAGGEVAAERLLGGCPGYLDPAAADLTVVVEESLPELSLYAESIEDTVLLVLDPEGFWSCDDDTFEHHPAVTYAPAPAGRYQLLVGTFSGTGGATVTLLAAPGPPRWSQAEEAVDLGTGAEPAAGRHRLPVDGSIVVPIPLSGGASASVAGGHCIGEIDPSRPDAVLYLPQPEPSLHLHVTSTEDTSLLVIAPDGTVHCNDDTYGLDPAVRLGDAPAGDYLIWVGSVSGPGAGAEAALHLARRAPPGLRAGGPGLDLAAANPLVGREFHTASDALAILMTETPLGEVLAYESLEELGPEGLRLTGILVRDPEGVEEPVAIERIEVRELDLEGLRESGEPERFSLRIEGMDYRALSGRVGTEGPVTLPTFDDAPTVSIVASLLPAGGPGERMAVEGGVRLDGHLGVHVSGIVQPPPGMPPGQTSFPDMLTESLAVELQDLGFVGAALRARAVRDGTTVQALVEDGLATLRSLLGPTEAGGSRAQLLEALTAALADLDRPGAIRLELRSRDPQPLETLREILGGDDPGDDRVEVRIEYVPIR